MNAYRRNNRARVRFVGTLVAAVAVMGVGGAGTASAATMTTAHAGHEAAPASTLTSPVGESVDALWKHVEMYHLSDPSWELTSMLTDPSGNLKVHGQMLDDTLSPLVGTATGALGG
ncbi:hypothetical protein [Streptomyces purpurogeneiscleroticus]|uniref:hypothetical protein n=1 Tax=Streptomyces purpurogeneiscleroticus TaxID=68259 RepID=UPI001CBE0091|nr:hypothetical protein [Streptomyces purpurogeneiscleroticus]